MILTVQNLVNGSPAGLQHKVRFGHGGTLMQGDYQPVGLGEVRRTWSNRALRDALDEIKYACTIAGNGWQSAGLHGLNLLLPVRVGFIAPMCQQSAGGAITPIRTARSDIAPYAVAIKDSGPVNTTLTGWTPGAVVGALYYLIYFYPEMDGYLTLGDGLDEGSGTFDWTLNFEEI